MVAEGIGPTFVPIGLYVYTLDPRMELEDNLLDIIKHAAYYLDDYECKWDLTLCIVAKKKYGSDEHEHKYYKYDGCKPEDAHNHLYGLFKEIYDHIDKYGLRRCTKVTMEIKFWGTNYFVSLPLHWKAVEMELEEQAKIADYGETAFYDIHSIREDTALRLTEKYEQLVCKLADAWKAEGIDL